MYVCVCVWRSCMCVFMLSHFSCVWLFEIPWTMAYHAPLSMGCSMQEYWTCHFFLQGNIPDPGIKPKSLSSPALQADSLSTESVNLVWTKVHILGDVTSKKSLRTFLRTYMWNQDLLRKYFQHRKSHLSMLLLPWLLYRLGFFFWPPSQSSLYK